MQWSRARIAVAALVAVAGVGAVVGLSGGLQERDDERIPVADVGERLETSRADVTIEGAEMLEEGDVAVTVTITNHLAVPLFNDDVMELADEQGTLAQWGYGTSDGVSANASQPGVTDTFVVEFVLDREPVGALHVEVLDATWTPRDETAFGIGANMYDEHVAAIVRLP
ncbi:MULTISPECIES: hypothetical protein [unclassified Agrococcus]|uniref:hypothetical protein n=1 Tax=unclassified Agrococcus TaxID=2615065 RepID=UPI003609D482